jgi:hypothetical protein
MSLDKDTPIFENISLSDIFKDIYNNSRGKQKQIDDMLDKMGNLIKGVTDASMILPLLKEIMDVSVKNDEQLVKLAGIIQRLLQVDNNPKSGGLGVDLLPEHEKNQILENVKNNMDTRKIDAQLEQLDEKVKAAKEIIHKENTKLLNQVINDVGK